MNDAYCARCYSQLRDNERVVPLMTWNSELGAVSADEPVAYVHLDCLAEVPEPDEYDGL